MNIALNCLVFACSVFVNCTSSSPPDRNLHHSNDANIDSNAFNEKKLEDELNSLKSVSQEIGKTIVVIDNLFAYDVLSGDPLLPKAKKKFDDVKSKLELAKNRLYPNKVDSITTFSSHADTLQIHKAFGREIIIKMVLRSINVNLTNIVNMETKKNYFVQKYNLDEDFTRLKITELEGGIEFMFTFNGNDIEEIRYEPIPF